MHAEASHRRTTRIRGLDFHYTHFYVRTVAGAQTNSSAAQLPHPWDQNPDGMRIYIWAGLKSHDAGQHDYPQFLADWSKLLTEHGARVDGALHAPHRRRSRAHRCRHHLQGRRRLSHRRREDRLEAYVKRGGGLVSLHDSLCGPDPAYFATLLGGAKKHGEVNYTLEAAHPYTVADPADPIMKGMSRLHPRR